MASLRDMEEMISTVKDKDIAEYLYEAFRCYGAGAYRATIVVTNIALFEGLRQKINALAPVSKVCKEIADEINPLADSQKVFETPLIHKLRSKNILSELEASRLEQLNSHRNKAAHPSGHSPSPEEARFVFSEAIGTFLSKPIRQTTYVVDQIIDNLSNDNLFPSLNRKEIGTIVAEQVANLDDSAWNFLFSKLALSLNSQNSIEKKNANSFIVGLTMINNPMMRDSLSKKILIPFLPQTEKSEIVSIIIGCLPEIIESLNDAEMIQLDSILVKNSSHQSVDDDTLKLENPTYIATNIMLRCSESKSSKLKNFWSLIIKKSPLVPRFITALPKHSANHAALRAKYVEIAGSSTFDVANRIARRLGELDDALSKSFDEKFTFEIIAGIVKASRVGAFASINVVDNKFKDNPLLKGRASTYSKLHLKECRTILRELGIPDALPTFRRDHFK